MLVTELTAIPGPAHPGCFPTSALPRRVLLRSRHPRLSTDGWPTAMRLRLGHRSGHVEPSRRCRGRVECTQTDSRVVVCYHPRDQLAGVVVDRARMSDEDGV